MTHRHSRQKWRWPRSRAITGAAEVFGRELGTREPAVDVTRLHAKIGQLSLENDFLEGALSKAGLLSAKR